MNSRPCIMSDIDISVEPLTPSQSGSVTFDIWFRIAQMLNHVIGLYRPTNPESITGWDFEYVGFEQIVDEFKGWHLSSSTLATLNIFFLATATLAHRLKSIKTLPTPTPARLRQQLSAIQIVRFMKDPARLQTLHPIPIAIYATSLALSVSYQQLRYSRLPSDQEDARQDFNDACSILQTLRVNWPAADAMASLAQKISIELDKIPSLDLLRIDRSHVSDRVARSGRQGIRTRRDSMVENENENEAILTGGEPSKDRQESLMNVFDNLETFNLFGGMDDISWMYLDGENPVNFENLLFRDFNAQEP
ncbi:Fungal-trans domain-containing protein [Fusarium sp. Ph1]|nr:Fungal-trans domain-containing protein [Fusarium sp. Ph1]